MLSKMFPKAGQNVPEIRLDGFEGEWEIKRADEIFKSVSEKIKLSYLCYQHLKLMVWF